MFCNESRESVADLLSMVYGLTLCSTLEFSSK